MSRRGHGVARRWPRAHVSPVCRQAKSRQREQFNECSARCMSNLCHDLSAGRACQGNLRARKTKLVTILSRHRKNRGCLFPRSSCRTDSNFGLTFQKYCTLDRPGSDSSIITFAIERATAASTSVSKFPNSISPSLCCDSRDANWHPVIYLGSASSLSSSLRWKTFGTASRMPLSESGLAISAFR
jgi:hypothetical protein